MKEISAFFGDKTGVEILLDVMKHQSSDLELAALSLQYFLHIAADHSDHLNEDQLSLFHKDIVPELLKDELTRELLIETYHRYSHPHPAEWY